jgi:hypothetical protein
MKKNWIMKRHKKRKMTTYLESCQICIKDFCGYLPQTWTNTTITSVRNTKKNALIGVVDSCKEECRKKVIKKHIINKKKYFNGDRKRKTWKFHILKPRPKPKPKKIWNQMREKQIDEC